MTRWLVEEAAVCVAAQRIQSRARAMDLYSERDAGDRGPVFPDQQQCTADADAGVDMRAVGCAAGP